jgi:hypothetical protein
MNFDDIQQTWRSPHNRPSAAQLEKDQMKFLNDLRKRHRGEIIFMIWILAVMSFLTGAFVLHLVRPDPARQPTELTQEWAPLVLLALPWMALGVFCKKFREHRARHACPERSIRASVAALLDENRTEAERYKWVGRLNGAVILLLSLLVYQLRAAGKAGDEILVPAFVVVPVLLLGVFLAMRRYQRRVLLPRQRELEALLVAYGETEATT